MPLSGPLVAWNNMWYIVWQSVKSLMMRSHFLILQSSWCNYDLQPPPPWLLLCVSAVFSLGFTKFIGSEGFKVTFIISSQVWTHYDAWLSRSLQIFYLVSNIFNPVPSNIFVRTMKKKVPVMCNKYGTGQGFSVLKSISVWRTHYGVWLTFHHPLPSCRPGSGGGGNGNSF